MVYMIIVHGVYVYTVQIMYMVYSFIVHGYTLYLHGVCYLYTVNFLTPCKFIVYMV
jgi:hypothetical protein